MIARDRSSMVGVYNLLGAMGGLSLLAWALSKVEQPVGDAMAGDVDSSAASVAVADPPAPVVPVESVQNDIVTDLALIGQMKTEMNACAALQRMAKMFTGRLTQTDFSRMVQLYLERVDLHNEAEVQKANYVKRALNIMRSQACAPFLALSPLRSVHSFPV